MAVWKHTIALKDLLDDDNSSENVKRVAKAVHERLELARSTPPLNREDFDPDELEQISDEFHTIAFADQIADVAYFNDVLHSLYDWADRARVWVN